MGLILPGRVQVAGVFDQAEADLIIEAGADMLGYPLCLEDGREDLEINEAAEIVRATAGKTTSVCITYLRKAEDIASLCRRLGVDWVQLHGPVETSELEKLRREEESLHVIKSLIVSSGAESDLFRLLDRCEPLVDAFITDTFDPGTGRSGATGKTHDWSVSQEIVLSTTRPVILAGGLNPDNVAGAIGTVRPAAVDAHTGVEGPDGRKSATLVSSFVAAAREAFSELHAGSYSAESHRSS